MKRGEAAAWTGVATWAWVAVVVAILDGIAELSAFVIAAATHQSMGLSANSVWINAFAAPTFPLLAALMFRSRGRDPVRPGRLDRLAWLFVGFGMLCAATFLLFALSVYGFQHHEPGTLAVAWVASWLWTGVAPGLLLALLWFPTGEAPGRRWRWAEGCAVLSFVLLWASVAFHPGPMTDFAAYHVNPVGWPGGAKPLDAAGGAGLGALAITALAAVASVAARFRRGDASVRAQLRWLVAILALIALSIAVPRHVLPPVSDALTILGTGLLPVTLAVALTRRDGYGLPRVLVYGALSALLLAGYLATVAVVQAVFGSGAHRAAGLAAAAVVAVLAAPLRMRLQRAVDRLVYGERGDPYTALSDLGRRIAGTPNELLHEAVAAVTEALRAPYAAVFLDGDSEPTTEAGTPASPTVTVPLTLRGAGVGSLIVAQRSPVEAYGPRDLALLRDLAGHISVAAHAASLTRDLQRSRESLVIAREEERRRIRRELHDGLGPALAGVAFGLDAARNTLSRDPVTADLALAELKAELQGSIADIRRLVYDLRPPALDQLGLVPALQEYAGRLGERGALQVTVITAPLPPLPAAVEVAAYRIATEALTNAARHARARQTSVTLNVEDAALRLEIADDGIGIRDERGIGIGLTGMSERAAELGGTFRVAPRSQGGTSVVATLPVRVVS